VLYKRHRPHWFPENRAVFITWRLCGSIAVAEIERVRRAEESGAALRFKKLDDILDKARTGPTWLAETAIAKIVCDSIFHGDEIEKYELDSYVVMSNHVHILVWPLSPVPEIMRSLKSFTARDANRILRREGCSFWQDESFDHWVRHEAQHLKIRAYVENNPVKAGMATRPEDWPWSSASERGRPPRRRLSGDPLLERYHPKL
jgi:putative transposase